MHTLWFVLIASLLLMPATDLFSAQFQEIPIDGFTDVSSWQPHQDGGHPPNFSNDKELSRPGRPAMRVDYKDRAPHWGNLRRRIRVPEKAVALTFKLYKHHAAPQAAMHIWLFEPDGDRWVQRVWFDHKNLSEIADGWHDVTVPVSAFAFRRKKGTPQMSTCDAMLLGCNFGDLSVTITDAKWLLLKGPEARPPRTANLKISRSGKGVIAIWKDPVECAGAQSSPDVLARVFRAGGWTVYFLKGGDMADPSVLRPDTIDLVVLPYGPAFPLIAREVFVQYLKQGGSFLSMGGYAFDRMVSWNGKTWTETQSDVTAKEAGKVLPTYPMNTRSGHAGDTMRTLPDQIGVFDPAYLLTNAVKLSAAEDQFIFPPNVTEVRGHGEENEQQGFEGYAATCLDSRNSPVFPARWARYVPLLQTEDEFGRRRGPAGAMMLHYDGPYRGSAWAFFGVNNFDLFANPESPLCKSLPRLAETITRKTFFADFRPELYCYRAGEKPTILVTVANFGRTAQRVSVSIVREHLHQKATSTSSSAEITIKPGQQHTFKIPVEPVPAENGELVRLRGELRIDGEIVDAARTAFVVWKPKAVEGRAAFRFKNNYFGFGDWPRFFCGTNETGMVFYSADEHPLVWDKDFQAMADRGVRILRILHFSPFVTKEPGRIRAVPLDLAKEPPLRLQRQMDAIVALAQKHGLVVFLALHDWMEEELKQEELDAQRKWAQFWAERYRDVPNIMFDIQNEPGINCPNSPFVIELWNEWLLRKYGSREAVWRAWGQKGHAPAQFTFEQPAPSNAWTDMHEVDIQRFRVYLLNRWAKANAEGIRKGNPRVPFTIGFLPSMPPADKILGTRHLTFSNSHFYGNVFTLPWELKLIDQRLLGKSFSLGEFGAQEAHDARVRGKDGTCDRASIKRFLLTTLATFGLGGSFACNWDWKDMYGAVFPWGLNHQDLVPKPVMTAFRNMAILLGAPEPKWAVPDVWFVIPDSYRLGPRYAQIHQHLHNALAALSACRVNFAVVNEENLNNVRGIPNALIWPLVYCPSDDVFDRVMELVNKGAALLMTGNPCYGPLRRRTREERLKRLGLPVPAPQDPFATPEKIADPVYRQIGKGRIAFVPGAIELCPQKAIHSVYTAFLDKAGIQRLPIQGEGYVYCGAVDTREGGRVLVAFSQEPKCTLTLSSKKTSIRVDMADHLPSFAWFDGEGNCRAVSLCGHSAQPASAACISLDGKNLREAEAVAVLPFLPGRIALPCHALPTDAVMQRVDFVENKARLLGEPERIRTAATVEISLPNSLDVMIISRRARMRSAIHEIETMLYGTP